VVAFASLRRFFPGLKLGDVRWMEFPVGTTLREVMHLLEIPEEEVKVVMRNNLQASLNDMVEDGDRIAFMPAMAGGCL